MNKGQKKHTQFENGEALVKIQYTLSLFVTGATPNSVRAVANIKSICEKYIAGKYLLEIIDVYKHTEIAEQEQMVALPMLIKKLPLPQRKLIGDMSNTKKVLEALGLHD